MVTSLPVILSDQMSPSLSPMAPLSANLFMQHSDGAIRKYCLGLCLHSVSGCSTGKFLEYNELKVTTAFLADDLIGYLSTLLWPSMVIWMYKMVDHGHLGKRPLCRSQINSNNARVSQTIDRKGR